MPQWKGIIGAGFTPDELAEYVRKLTFTVWRPSFVVLHNTYRPTLKTWHDVPGEQRMLNLAHYYQVECKWSAGPHLFIADDKIWLFTPLTTSGVHTPSWNRTSWSVEIVGNYSTEAFKGKVRKHTVSALAILHAALGIPPDTLRLHRDDPKTTHTGCPGPAADKTPLVIDVGTMILERYAGEHALERDF